MTVRRDDPRRVDIHVRRTAHDGGQSEVALTVFCPVRQHSVEMHDCTSCQYCEGFSIDPADQVGFLTCRIKDAVGASLRPPDSKTRSSSPARIALTPIADIMTRSVVCIDPDMTLPSLMTLLLSRNISGAPVVDESGHPIGVVGKTDLVREFAEGGGDVTETARFVVKGYEVDLGPGYHMERARDRTVRDIMMPLSFTLPESAPIARAAALMAYEGVHRIIVTSPSGNVVGIVSSLDVLSWLARESGYLMTKEE